MSSKRKIAAVVLTTVALSVGTVGVATASQPKGKSVSVKTTSTKTTVNSIANPMAGGAMGAKMGGREGELTSILAGLVTKGTITQAQSDAITAAHAARAAEHGKDHDGNDAQRVARDALIATTIGIDAATIKSRLAAGETLGAIAGDKKAALITALVAQGTQNIDAAVTAGKVTAAQAVTLKAGLTAHVTAGIDAVRGAKGPGKGKHGPGHRNGGMGKNH